MPQIKNADGFLHQRFYVPFTRRQALHATQLSYTRFSALHATKLLYTPEGLYTSAGLYSRFSALHATQLPYPASGPYPRFSALHAACCFPRPQALKPFERCEATLERCVAALNLEPKVTDRSSAVMHGARNSKGGSLELREAHLERCVAALNS